jgi:hypothetical protein
MLKKIRAWLDRRTKGSVDPSKIDSDRQDAMATPGLVAPVNYVPPTDEGRPRH